MNTISNFQDFINESYYSPAKEYAYDFVANRLRRGPSYMKKLIKDLPRIPRTNEKGEQIIMTRISEQIYNYLFNPNW